MLFVLMWCTCIIQAIISGIFLITNVFVDTLSRRFSNQYGRIAGATLGSRYSESGVDDAFVDGDSNASRTKFALEPITVEILFIFSIQFAIVAAMGICISCIRNHAVISLLGGLVAWFVGHASILLFLDSQNFIGFVSLLWSLCSIGSGLLSATSFYVFDRALDAAKLVQSDPQTAYIMRFAVTVSPSIFALAYPITFGKMFVSERLELQRYEGVEEAYVDIWNDTWHSLLFSGGVMLFMSTIIIIMMIYHWGELLGLGAKNRDVTKSIQTSTQHNGANRSKSHMTIDRESALIVIVNALTLCAFVLGVIFYNALFWTPYLAFVSIAMSALSPDERIHVSSRITWISGLAALSSRLFAALSISASQHAYNTTNQQSMQLYKSHGQSSVQKDDESTDFSVCMLVYAWLLSPQVIQIIASTGMLICVLVWPARIGNDFYVVQFLYTFCAGFVAFSVKPAIRRYNEDAAVWYLNLILHLGSFLGLLTSAMIVLFFAGTTLESLKLYAIVCSIVMVLSFLVALILHIAARTCT